MRYRAALLLLLAAPGVFARPMDQRALEPQRRTLTYEDRAAAQKAIEQVFWRHRIWPKENPGPKPALSAVMSDETIQARVTDYLRKSNALEKWWRRPITADQLQAEMERMTKGSRDGQVLRELFAALGDDPLLIAETLARQTLADRLIHNWYENDLRFHGEVKRRAEAAQAECARIDCLKSMGGDYSETTVRLRADHGDAVEERDAALDIVLDADEWAGHLDRLATELGATPRTLTAGRLGGLEETADAFIVSGVLARRDGEIVTASVAWPKPTFEAWWSAERNQITELIDQPRAVYSLPAAPVSACANDTWAATGVIAPESRVYHSAVWTGSELIYWGGKNGSGYAERTGGRYSPSTDTWADVSTGPSNPTARFGHTAVWTGTEMIVWGGTLDGSFLGPKNTGGRYNPSTDSWTMTSAGLNVPSPRFAHTAVWTGTRMIVWGGKYCDFVQGQCTVNNVNSGGRYDPSSNSWTPTSTGANVPASRYDHTAVWTGTEMIVWGGVAWSAISGEIQKTGGRYNPDSDTWSPTSTGAGVPIARTNHTAVWTGTEMLVWGGWDLSTLTNTGGRYSPASDTWISTATTTSAPSARYDHTAVWTGMEMIVWGGNTGATINTGGRYNPSTNSWTTTSTGANTPSARRFHTAVWTGAQMIVWGGYSGTEVLSTGGRYDPSTDTWTPTAVTAAPTARRMASAVWTGAEMVVWGGLRLSSDYQNTGGRYYPSIDSWAPTSTGANVPSARAGHTAVWTGAEMLVWGGTGGGSTGGRYVPTSDSWTPTSTGFGVPAPRGAHTAVWTGTEMIVWGGYWSGYLGSGGRYAPASDSWTPTSMGANTPSAREYHSAVWTGAEMIVWGGTNGAQTNTGGRYVPASDSWTPTSINVFTPSERHSHSAVWTGSEMIVWGGFEDTDYCATGGRYIPATDTWTYRVPGGGNLPSLRGHHTAVWTGAEMIVWGGYNGVNYFNTGGRFDAATERWTATSTGVNTPPARGYHNAVWTGTEMIVWGGEPSTVIGGRYCVCPSLHTYYRDADGDGFGDGAVPVSACEATPPAGYAADSTDCDDGDPSIHPNAPEINDGIDNQCPGEPGFGLVDEISGSSGFTSPGDKTRFAWDPQAGATSYEIVRSSTADFSSGCLEFFTSAAYIDDPETPPGDGAFYYLVRSSAPYVGSWGQGVGGAPRTVACVAP